jgi:hypothetical protein
MADAKGKPRRAAALARSAAILAARTPIPDSGRKWPGRACAPRWDRAE